MFGEVGKAFDLIEPQRRGRFAAVLLMMVITAIVQSVGVASVMPFISLVADPGIITRNEWMARAYDALGFESTREFLIAVGVGSILILAVSNAVSAIGRWMSVRFVWDLHHSLTQRLLRKYLCAPYSFFLERNSSELTKNLLAQVRGVIDYVVMPCVDILARGATAVFLVLLLVLVDPVLAVVAGLALTGAYTLVYLALRGTQRELGIQRHNAFSDRFQIVGEAFGGIKDVKVLENEQLFLDRFDEASRRFSRVSTRQAVLAEIPRYALETVAFGGIIATIVYLLETRESLNQVLPIVALYAIAGYRLMPALQTIFVALSNIRFYTPMLVSLHEDLFAPVEGTLHEVGSAGENAVEPISFEREIRFRAVEFSYPRRQTPAIASIDLVIPVNQTIGLIGSTGSGKTTIVDLLLGLFEPSAGQILIDDVPLGRANASSWKRMIGYVSQSIYLADGTVAQNIAFGVPDEQIDWEAVERAAAAAHLDAFVEKLPQGYHTVVGERGIRLSGGERQRIAIARALYRDPRVLVMDEATSALDGATEEAVMQAIRELSGRKTIILIAHRLTTVRECDIIYLIDDGRVAAQGTYAELAAGNAAFRAMARENRAASM